MWALLAEVTAVASPRVPHPEIANTSRRALQELYLEDEQARPVLVVVLRETWHSEGLAVVPLEPEPPIVVAGELHAPLVDGVTPSARLEPEVAFVKPSTDVLLLGTARPASRGARQGLVRLRAGKLDKSVVVFGERRWLRGAGEPKLSAPEPFEAVSLRWEHAYGGPLERRNPVGRGAFGPGQPYVDGTRAPGLERPDQLLRAWRDQPEPAGFGVVSGGWLPRAQYAGSYDEAWSTSRMPSLPADFQRRYFQAAPADQVSRTPWRGDERLRVEGAGRAALWDVALPGRSRPTLLVRLRDRQEAPTPMLDTVVVDADAQTVALTWRASVVLTRGAHDVRGILAGEAPLA